MLFTTYSCEVLCKQFHLIYLQGDIKLLLATVNNSLIFAIRIVHDLSCHPVVVVVVVVCSFNWCFLRDILLSVVEQKSERDQFKEHL